MRTSRLTVDSRVRFTQRDYYLIETKVKDRIFTRGHNSLDQQMLPALSYNSYNNLYRFLTGRLRKSLAVGYYNNQSIAIYIDYEEVILNSLEDRYGIIFNWSPSDVAYANKVMESRLIAQGFDEDDGRDTQDIGLPPRPTDGSPQVPTNSVEQDQARNLSSDLEERARDLSRAKSGSTKKPSIPTPESDVKVRKRFTFEYSPKHKLSSADLLAFETFARERLFAKQDFNGGRLPPDYAELIDYDTITSLQITNPRKGVLAMKITISNSKIWLIHQKRVLIFGFGIKEALFLNRLLKSY